MKFIGAFLFVAGCCALGGVRGEVVSLPFKLAGSRSATKVISGVSTLESDGFDRTVDLKGYTELALYSLRNVKCALQELDISDQVRVAHMLPVLRSIESASDVAKRIGKTFSTKDGDEKKLIDVARVAAAAASALTEELTNVRFDDDNAAPKSVQIDVSNPTIILAAEGMQAEIAMPIVGFGTWGTEAESEDALWTDDDTEKAVAAALEAGYRLIDTAEAYRNHEAIGRAIAASNIPREEIFIVDKLGQAWGKQSARDLVEDNLAKLGVSYIDMLYLHHAIDDTPLMRQTWRELETMVSEGLIRSLGTSNFVKEKFELLVNEIAVAVKPAAAQNKYQPFFKMMPHNPDGDDLQALASEHGAAFVGHSSIRQWPFKTAPLEDAHIQHIAARHGKTPAQVVIRWMLQMGVAAIPRSKDQEHILENIDVFDFALSDREVQLIDSLDYFTAGFSKPIHGDAFDVQRHLPEHEYLSEKRDEL